MPCEKSHSEWRTPAACPPWLGAQRDSFEISRVYNATSVAINLTRHNSSVRSKDAWADGGTAGGGLVVHWRRHGGWRHGWWRHGDCVVGGGEVVVDSSAVSGSAASWWRGGQRRGGWRHGRWLAARWLAAQSVVVQRMAARLVAHAAVIAAAAAAVRTLVVLHALTGQCPPPGDAMDPA